MSQTHRLTTPLRGRVSRCPRRMLTGIHARHRYLLKPVRWSSRKGTRMASVSRNMGGEWLFNKISRHTWTKQQLKNRWYALRQKHNRFERLINCSGVAYNDSTGRICADEEWWERKIKKNKDYKEFKDKDCREVAAYKALFGDAFDADKYAVTPTKLCRTRFAVLEDSGYEDYSESIPVDIESSASSDKPKETYSDAAKINILGPRSRDKRRVTRETERGR